METRIVKSYDGKLYLEINEIRTPIFDGMEDYIDELAEMETGSHIHMIRSDD